MPGHIHMLIPIPTKYAFAQVVGFLKGKSAIAIARRFGGRKKNFSGQHFWARGYRVSTVGRDEEAICHYIKKHEEEDKRLDKQLDQMVSAEKDYYLKFRTLNLIQIAQQKNLNYFYLHNRHNCQKNIDKVKKRLKKRNKII